MNTLKLTIYLSILMFLIAGCNKEENGISTSIAGNWELRLSQTGMIPTINYAEGNGNIIQYSNEEYKVFSNGQLVKSGKYIIINDGSVKSEVCLETPPGEFTKRIIYDNDYTSPKIFIQLSKDKLSFLAGCFAYDGGMRKEYIRL